MPLSPALPTSTTKTGFPRKGDALLVSPLFRFQVTTGLETCPPTCSNAARARIKPSTKNVFPMYRVKQLYPRSPTPELELCSHKVSTGLEKCLPTCRAKQLRPRSPTAEPEKYPQKSRQQRATDWGHRGDTLPRHGRRARQGLARKPLVRHTKRPRGGLSRC